MKRLHEFDALRGIAALAVVFSHLLNYLPSTSINPYEHWSLPLWSFAVDGHFAVLIFFAISGFVLSYPYFIGAKDERSLKIDVVNRLPRLMIPVFLTGLLCLLLQGAASRIAGQEVLAPFAGPEWIARWDVAGWDFARAIEFLTTRVFIFYSETDTFNVNLWTMPVEMAFSFVVFGACALMLRRYDIAIAVFVVACFCIASWRAEPLEYMLKGLDGTAFFLGMFAARYVDTIRKTLSRFRALPALMIITGLLLSSVLLSPKLHYLAAEGLGLVATGIFFLGFIALAQAREFLAKPVFDFLGEVSFALYLIHGSVMYLVFQAIASLGAYGASAFLAGALLSLAVSFALSFVFTRYVEMPLVARVRRAIGSLIRGRSAA